MTLDQAIALVPSRWEWSVGSGNTIYGDRAWANVWPCDQPFPQECDVFEEGDTPADALEKAATTARALATDRQQEIAKCLAVLSDEK